jgi:DNA invertase Pin-like site-specific DNA recombinase
MRSARRPRPSSRASGAKDGSRLPELYDDGGFTGANMDRPALTRLLEAVEAGEWIAWWCIRSTV